jgi:uncharacterized protein
MALEMRNSCERCSNALAADAEAFICSYECTFCAVCTGEMQGICPNCKGELLRRPCRNVHNDFEDNPLECELKAAL